MAAQRLWFLAAASCVFGAKKKPLFEYDDHYVMLNDHGRNEYYRRALEDVVASCSAGCSVLDVGAGSGLLSMLAASAGAAHVLALEANPALADLAKQTVARNAPSRFPESNLTVVAALSSHVGLDHMPFSRPADVLVTETFGTIMLGEGAINFVPDARDRLLKRGGVMIPSGGCQYATLVEVPEFFATVSPGGWSGLNLSRLEMLQDTVYWKATVGASRSPLNRLSDRVCILEVDLYNDTRDSIPSNRTIRVPARRSGFVHAVLLDWDIWTDAARTKRLSTSPGSRNFAGDVAWGWMLQLQEVADEAWRFGAQPSRLHVREGETLELGVEFIARGISMHVRSRRASASASSATATEVVVDAPVDGALLTAGSPARTLGLDRGDVIEANEIYLPIAGDTERHAFYASALAGALQTLRAKNGSGRTLLDCTGAAGVPALVAATQHGLKSLALPRRKAFAPVLRGLAKDNNVSTLMEAYAMDPRDLVAALLPDGERVDIVVVDPPGTPVHGLSPFAVLPAVRKHLLKEDGIVIPAGGCFQVALVESEDIAQLFSVPSGHWEHIDLTVWNEEALRQGLLGRLVPYTKWFGHNSTTALRWLSQPSCIFEVDLQAYAREAPLGESSTVVSLSVVESGRAHALMGHWVVWADSERTATLGPDSEYLGRAFSWPQYIQALASPEPLARGLIEPVAVRAGETRELEVLTRQGHSKITGAAGPEFTLRLAGAAKPLDEQAYADARGDGAEL